MRREGRVTWYKPGEACLEVGDDGRVTFYDAGEAPAEASKTPDRRKSGSASEARPIRHRVVKKRK